MRRERLYLSDILEAIDYIEEFVRNHTFESFHSSELLKSGVLQKLMVIGEAANRLPQTLQQQSPEIEWADIVAFRNIAVHAYFSVDWKIVWTTATKDISELKPKILALIQDFS